MFWKIENSTNGTYKIPLINQSGSNRKTAQAQMSFFLVTPCLSASWGVLPHPWVHLSQESTRPAGSVHVGLESRNTFHLPNMSVHLHHCSHHRISFCSHETKSARSEKYSSMCTGFLLIAHKKLFTVPRNAGTALLEQPYTVGTCFVPLFLDCLFSLVSSCSFLHV